MDITNQNRRVELINCEDTFTKLNPGEKGTYYATDDMGHHMIKWDNGSSLSLVPGIDSFKFLEKYKCDPTEVSLEIIMAAAQYTSEDLEGYNGDEPEDLCKTISNDFIEGESNKKSFKESCNCIINRFKN